MEHTHTTLEMRSFHICLFLVPAPYTSVAILCLIQLFKKWFDTRLSLKVVRKHTDPKEKLVLKIGTMNLAAR